MAIREQGHHCATDMVGHVYLGFRQSSIIQGVLRTTLISNGKSAFMGLVECHERRIGILFNCRSQYS